MSKSLNNFFNVREILKQYRAEEIRFFILASHYRNPLNYSNHHLDEARAALRRLYTALKGIKTHTDPVQIPEFSQAMEDDFNTPKAIAVMHKIAHEINRLQDKSSAKAIQLASMLKFLGKILGLLQEKPEQYLQSSITGEINGLSNEQIEDLVLQRKQSRKSKDFVEADRIRSLLSENKIILEDAGDHTTWKRI